MSWRTSLLLFFGPVVLLVATILVGRGPAPPQADDADRAGRIGIERSRGPAPTGPDGAESDPPAIELGVGGGATHSGEPRPITVVGRITDKQTGAPLAGAVVSVVSGDLPVDTTATTGADGSYVLTDVPAGGLVRVERREYATVEKPIGEGERLDLALTSTVVTGVVRDEGGAPVGGALVRVADGSTTAITTADGSFRLVGAAGAAELVVAAAGLADQRLAVPADLRVVVSLRPQTIKAIYANLDTLIDPARVDRLIEIADETEINALVIDVKQDTIYYDTRVPFFRDIEGMVTPVFAPAELLATLEAHGIYAIARMVVFKDPVVAEARPDLAVMDAGTGWLWRDRKGVAWVNPFAGELWQANVDLAVELAGMGFDEVQYDYVRFPADGDLSSMDFGWPVTEERRVDAITGFLAMSRERLAPTGTKLAADVFGFTLTVDDLGIGQNLARIAAVVDYVCPMVYPSHWPEGSLPVDGHPNDFPYETVALSLGSGTEKLAGQSRKLRPWIQDFTWPDMAEYGSAELRAQIDAAEASGASGWMVWDPTNEYHTTAFAPADRSLRGDGDRAQPVGTAQPNASPATASRRLVRYRFRRSPARRRTLLAGARATSGD